MKAFINFILMILGIIAIIIVATVVYVLMSSEDKEGALPSVCKDDGMAFIMSKKFVERELKSPSSADFPSKPVSSSSLGECHFRINAYVDAQNSFGAMIRTNYSIDMKYNPSNKMWSGANLKM